jgi:hypothetical protein
MYEERRPLPDALAAAGAVHVLQGAQEWPQPVGLEWVGLGIHYKFVQSSFGRKAHGRFWFFKVSGK